MQKIREWMNHLSGWGESVAVIGVLLMVALNCADVIGSKFFKMPIPDSTELVRLVQATTIAFAIAATQKVGGHINVDMFLTKMHPRLQAIVRSFTSFLGAMLFAIAVYEAFQYGYALYEDSEVTGTLRIPFYPFAFAYAIALVPLACMLACDLIESVKEVLIPWSR